MRSPAPQNLAERGVELVTALAWAYWIESVESDPFDRPHGYAIARLKQNPRAEPDGLYKLYDDIRAEPDRFRCAGICEFCTQGAGFDRALDDLLLDG